MCVKDLLKVPCIWSNRYIKGRDVNKDLTPKDQDKDKDLTPKDQDKDKELLDLTPRTRTRT